MGIPPTVSSIHHLKCAFKSKYHVHHPKIPPKSQTPEDQSKVLVTLVDEKANPQRWRTLKRIREEISFAFSQYPTLVGAFLMFLRGGRGCFLQNRTDDQMRRYPFRAEFFSRLSTFPLKSCTFLQISPVTSVSLPYGAAAACQ